jgi:hypothetical protein
MPGYNANRITAYDGVGVNDVCLTKKSFPAYGCEDEK